MLEAAGAVKIWKWSASEEADLDGRQSRIVEGKNKSDRGVTARMFFLGNLFISFLKLINGYSIRLGAINR